jgi:hypothetical protein
MRGRQGDLSLDSYESPHGHFKRRLSQALYLRQSCDFESVSAYQQFIEQEVAKLNARCSIKFAEEQQHLQALPQYRYTDYEELTVRVTCFSSINVRAVIYSVPSRLIGLKLTLHLYHDRLVGFLGSQPVLTLERVHVPGSNAIRRARVIDYRHLVEGLRRKPRAFLNCTWQQDLLPNDEWRDLWSRLRCGGDLDDSARIMVEALYIAAQQDQEVAVANYLDKQLQQNTLTLVGLQQHFESAATTPPIVRVQQHDLISYDQFLTCDPFPASSDGSESLRQPEMPSQEPETATYVGTLATTGTTSHPGTLVLRAVLACFMRAGSPKALHPQGATGNERSSTPEWKKLNQLRL